MQVSIHREWLDNPRYLHKMRYNATVNKNEEGSLLVK